MFENMISVDNISFLLVLAEGLLSFLSPCVIPLIPVYMSYLAGNAKQVDDNLSITYDRKRVLFHTTFFVIGISAAFFILGMAFSTLGTFFRSNQLLFTRIGGILIVILGLYQTGIFEFRFLKRERRLPLNFSKIKLNPAAAFLMGFTFSFSWTPCVGPALSSVLIMVSGAKNPLLGNILILVYTLGFTVPFLLLGLFTTQVLNYLKKHQKLLKYTVKAGGIILILIGIMIFTGRMNTISRYLNSFTPSSTQGKTKEGSDESEKDIVDDSLDTDDRHNDTDSNSLNEDRSDPSSENYQNEGEENAAEDEADEPETKQYDFTLTDQYGNSHTLSDYWGKVVFLNFWATWCPPCRKEMPDIEELYIEYGINEDDVVFLGVSSPYTDENPYTRETDKDGVKRFLEENKFTFPTLFDETGKIYSMYMISSLPTTFIIDKNGDFYGYATGMMTKDQMESSIEQALEIIKK